MLGFYCLLVLFDICWENHAGDATDWGTHRRVKGAERYSQHKEYHLEERAKDH